MKISAFTSPQKYRRNTLFTREINNKVYVFDPKHGKIIELNGSGSMIWNILTRPHTIEDIANQITAQYDIQLPEARKDVSEFINNMIKSGFICLDKNTTQT